MGDNYYTLCWLGIKRIGEYIMPPNHYKLENFSKQGCYECLQEKKVGVFPQWLFIDLERYINAIDTRLRMLSARHPQIAQKYGLYKSPEDQPRSRYKCRSKSGGMKIPYWRIMNKLEILGGNIDATAEAFGLAGQTVLRAMHRYGFKTGLAFKKYLAQGNGTEQQE